MLPSSGSMRVCGECGVVSARRRSTCAACGASALVAREVRTTPGASWVRLTARFVCRSCGQSSPLEGLDVDGTVTCLPCGSTQAFDLGAWSAALDFAHGLADLASSTAAGAPSPSGNPFASSGDAESTFRFETTGLRTIAGVVRTASIAIDAGLAQPLCVQCKAPLIAGKQGDELTTTCSGCGDVAHYKLPSPQTPITPFPAAIISGESRTDAAQVTVESGPGGAVAIRCPSCSAALPAAALHSVVQCAYCRATCRIPARTLRALDSTSVAPRPFFLAFSGPSALRGRLSAEAQHAQGTLESLRSIEPIPNVTRNPMSELMRALLCLLVLAAVGVFYAPRILALIESTSASSRGGVL